MAQRGAWLGLVVGLAVGCADSERAPDGTGSDPDAAVDGGRSGAGAGGAGAGGAGAGGGGDGPACEDLPMPGVYACVQGEGIPMRGTGPANVELTGVVERAETAPFECMAERASRTFGNVGERGQSYAVRDGGKTIELTLGTGSARPLLTVGQRVRVAVDEMPNGSTLLGDSAVLSVREDDEDGRLLYWFARTDDGLAGLELPDGFTASNIEPECMFDWECGVKHRRGLALLEGSGEVAIAIGELAKIGDVAALLFDNTELVLGTGGSCFDVAPYRRMSVALFDRDLISKCDWREEDSYADDDCRDVHAHLVGSGDPSSDLFVCVEDSSCSDGDAETCAVNDETQLLTKFTTTCVPPGWTQVNYNACDEDTDAGL